MDRKQYAVNTVVKAAQEYAAELLNKDLLFVCTDKRLRVSYLDVTFKAYNFFHLTGLKTINVPSTTIKSSEDFFQKCLDNKLSPDDFEFAEDGTTPLKLAVLPLVITKDLSARSLGIYNHTRPKLFTDKLVGGTKACIGFIEQTGIGYVPNTLLHNDIKDLIFGESHLRIAAIYRKNCSEENYAECVYVAKKVDPLQLKHTDRYRYLLDLHTPALP